MADERPVLTSADDGVRGVIAPYYLCLEGSGVRPGPAPGRTWHLTDGQGNRAVVTSRLPSEDRIVVGVEATGEQPATLEISRTWRADGLHLAIRRTLSLGDQVAWENGLSLPTAWFLDQAETAVTEAAADPLVGKLRATLRLDRFAGEDFDLPDWSPLPRKTLPDGKSVLANYDDMDVIRVRMDIRSEKLGIDIADLRLYFALGHGIARITGRVMEKHLNFHLADIDD